MLEQRGEASAGTQLGTVRESFLAGERFLASFGLVAFPLQGLSSLSRWPSAFFCGSISHGAGCSLRWLCGEPFQPLRDPMQQPECTCAYTLFMASWALSSEFSVAGCLFALLLVGLEPLRIAHGIKERLDQSSWLRVGFAGGSSGKGAPLLPY